MPKKPTLRSVQLDFQHWRANKSTLGRQVPAPLRQNAVALLKELPAMSITNALGINHTMLTAWANEIPDTSPIPIEFIPLPSIAPEATTAPPSDELTLNVTQPNGAQWHLQGRINPAQLSAFIHAIGASSGAAQ